MLKNLSLVFILSILLIACTNSNEPTFYTFYSGSWKCEETSSVNGYIQPYMVIVDRNSIDTTQYIVRNFFDTGDNQMIVVRIDGTSIELLQQPTSGHILRSFSGICTPYTQIKLNYTIYDGERDVFFEAVYSRK
jgi:hypothetical protein